MLGALVEPVVLAEDIDDAARMELHTLGEQAPVVVGRHEAISWLSSSHRPVLGHGPHLRLLHPAQRCRGAREVLLGDEEELVGLVLVAVHAAPQADSTVLDGDPRVVPRRDPGAAQLSANSMSLPILRSRVQTAHGFGVRPRPYSDTKYSMTSPNSSLRSMAWKGMSRRDATMRASRASPREQQDFFEASDSLTSTPFRMNRPTRS